MASQSPSTTVQKVFTVSEVPAAGSLLILGDFDFRGHCWQVMVYTYKGVPDDEESVLVTVNDMDAFNLLLLGVGLDGDDFTRSASSATAIDVSIEILALRRRELAVFTNMEEPRTLASDDWSKYLSVKRTDVDDEFTVRCTLDARMKKKTIKWWCWYYQQQLTNSFSWRRRLLVLDGLDGSHTLAIGSFSKLKAALPAGKCVRSTPFCLAGDTWYFKLYPNGLCNAGRDWPLFFLTRCSATTAPAPATTTRAEFKFELLAADGAKYYESAKVKHTFDDRANSQHALRVPAKSVAQHDRLVVRCWLAVLSAVPPRHPAATTMAASHESESLLTPLLSARAMHV